MTENGIQSSPVITLWIIAGAPFFMGTMCAPLIGTYGQQIAYEFGVFLIAIALIASAIAYKMRNEKKQSTICIVVLSLLLFTISFGAVVFIHDRYVNPTEDYCQSIGTDEREGSSWGRVVVLKTGQCVKDETGFHANGRAIFP